MDRYRNIFNVPTVVPSPPPRHGGLTFPIPSSSSDNKLSNNISVSSLIASLPSRYGRPLFQSRSVSAKVGVIPEANGSSFMECGNSKVICSVYGPKEVSSKSSFSDSAQVSVDFRQTTFCGPKRKPFMPQPEDKEIGQRILNAIEPAILKSKYPKSAISIHVLVLENDGGILPLAVNAASLALIHSGIELSDTVVAAELSCLDNVLIYDLSLDEERDLLEWESRSGRRFSHRKSFFAVMPNLNQITSYSVLGETNVETIAKEMSVCMETANTTMTLFQKALVAVTKDEQQHQ